MSLGVGALSLGGGWGLLGDVGILSWFPQMLATSVGGSYVASESLRLAMLAPLAGLMIQSRTHEMESDHLGQEVAYIAGADPTRMAQGWEDFIGFFERNFPRRLNLHQRIMRGHPDGRARLRSFEEQSRALERAFLGPHQRNAFGEELRERYAALHRQLKPYSEAYGRALRQRFEETERGRPDPRVRHSLSTLTGPQGLCLRHALGGG
jgi:predicted Zn-dependent protease